MGAVGEGAAELGSLEAKLAAADAGVVVTGPHPGAAGASQGAVTAPGGALVDESRQWIDAAMFYGDTVRTLLPDEAARHWTDDRLGKFGEALARCAQHYGWQWGGAAKHPLAMLAAAGFPLVWPVAAPYVMPYLTSKLRPAPASSPETASGSAAASPAVVVTAASAGIAAASEASSSSGARDPFTGKPIG
jgi:hypothetical protein